VIPHRHVRVAASGGVLLAFVGLWIGHTLEYLRVLGSDGLLASLASPVHAYMLPVAGLLATLSALFGIRLLRAWQALNRRLDQAASGLRRIWRGGAAMLPDAPVGRPSPAVRLVSLWLPLATAQIALYLVQENVEAIARGLPAPGWGAVSGIHWAAPLVHLYVALLLACCVRIVQVVLRRREAAVERVESLLRAAARRIRRVAPRVAAPRSTVRTPQHRLGWHLWHRPPPVLLGI